jgi:transcriptional regulator with XRE-family HTH domain
MDNPVVIGARIRRARSNQRLTQAGLAAAIGVTRSHLTNVENGKDSLALDKLAALATETNTTVAWLIGEDRPPNDPRLQEIFVAFRATDEQGRDMLLRLARSLRRDLAPESPAAESPAMPESRGLASPQAKGPDPPPRPILGGRVAESRARPGCTVNVRQFRVPA